MDILLTHGYFLAGDPQEQRIMKPYAPLGILSIAAYLKQHGIGAEVFDTTFSTMEAFEARLNEGRPPVVGIYTNLMTKFAVLKMIESCRAVGARVVLGGPEPAPYAAEYLACGADVIVEGEGEHALRDLLPALAQHGPHRLHDVAGIHFIDEMGAVVKTQPRPMIDDLDSLPMPARDAINLRLYLDAWRERHGYGSLSMICARGCPYHCTWCSHSVYGKTHRRFSPARMAKEARAILEEYRPDQLWYADDVFTINHRWLAEYAAELQTRGVTIPFECISRADRLTEPVMDTLRDMGCARLWIGSESGSQRILDIMRREVTVEQVQWATHQLKHRGIEVGMFIMLGYEGETEEDLRATVEHVRNAAPDIMLTTVAYPIKGTEYFGAVEDRIMSSADWVARTDRDLSVRGRQSKRFYSFAQRWMRGSFAVTRYTLGRDGNLLRMGKGMANVAVGRVGMTISKKS